jgi:tetratricopeptide (TPR) repeat protein
MRVPVALLHATIAAAIATAPCARAVAAPAAAADEDDSPKARADALSDEAVQKFEAKEYDAAVALFEDAYAIDPQPNYLFNIGRVYEEKGDLEKAVEFYQRFLGESGVDLESRQVATERLKVLREALKQLRDEPSERSAKPATSTDAQPGGDPAADRPRDAERTRKLRIAGYSLLGVGGVALIAGGAVGGVALGTTRDAEDAMFVDEQARLRRKARTQAGAADGLFIAGGVVAVVGLVLVLSTLRVGQGARSKASPATAARRTTFAPAFGRRGVGFGLTHRF